MEAGFKPCWVRRLLPTQADQHDTTMPLLKRKEKSASRSLKGKKEAGLLARQVRVRQVQTRQVRTGDDCRQKFNPMTSWVVIR